MEMDKNQNILLYADQFAALGGESELRILQLLLSAHPEGLVAGEIQARAWDLSVKSLASPGEAKERKSSASKTRRNVLKAYREHRRAP